MHTARAREAVTSDTTLPLLGWPTFGESDCHEEHYAKGFSAASAWRSRQSSNSALVPITSLPGDGQLGSVLGGRRELL